MIDVKFLRTVFFDGACHLCSREIEMIRMRAKPGTVGFVDISDPAFDPLAHGVDAARVNKHMHVRNDETGELHIGISSFPVLWEVVPGFRWLAAILRFPLVRPFAWLGYAIFAEIRPLLPKRQRRCDPGGCEVPAAAPRVVG